MSCVYQSNGFNDGPDCSLWDDTIEMNGCDENGYCSCSEDPDPSYTCDSYESDYVCPECDQDLNVEDCGCE